MVNTKIEAANELMKTIAERSEECTNEMRELCERLSAIGNSDELPESMWAESVSLMQRADTLKEIMEFYDEVVTAINKNIMSGDIPEVMKVLLGHLSELV